MTAVNLLLLTLAESVGSYRAQYLLGYGCQLKGFEHSEQLPLLVAEVVLHDRCDAFEVVVKLLRRRGPVDRGTEAAEQVGDHRVILLERAQHRPEFRMRSCDGWKQSAVFALVVGVESRAEAMAIQQQFTGGRLTGGAVGEGGARHGQRFPQSAVHPAEFLAPGDEPGRLALSHARAKGATNTSSASFDPAPPCLTRSATGTRRFPHTTAPVVPWTPRPSHMRA